MNDEEIKVVDFMALHGGSFVSRLAECFYVADRSNFLKLKTTFADYWDDYERQSKDVKTKTTFDELKEIYYKTHTCQSDDADSEQAKIERWAEEMGYEVID
jgi:hypothetical protein